MKILDKNGLYRATGWFSRDCEIMVDSLEKHGLVIVHRDEVDQVNQANELLQKMEDDLK